MPCITDTTFIRQIVDQLPLGKKCKVCGAELPDKEHLEKHKKVHGRKPKISESGGMDFSQVGF